MGDRGDHSFCFCFYFYLMFRYVRETVSRSVAESVLTTNNSTELHSLYKYISTSNINANSSNYQLLVAWIITSNTRPLMLLGMKLFSTESLMLFK